MKCDAIKSSLEKINHIVRKSLSKHLENWADYSVKPGKGKRDGEREGKVKVCKKFQVE